MALGLQLPLKQPNRNEPKKELVRQAERRAVAGAAAQRLEERGEGHRISGNSQRADRRAGDRTTSGGESIRPVEQPVQRRGTTTRAPSGPEIAPLRLPMQSQPKPAETGGSSQPGLSTGAGPAQPTPLTVPSHSFRTLEGLTSFWLRRLEENSSEINRDPLSQQLSRQNTDLSAAGANLFHAVVELQRLRASSERKFQRWFFETREQEERATENLAVMAKQLEDERNSRTQAIKEAVESERRKDQSDKVIAELKRELEIARSEARRAWDELGRREAEERERTIALRDGQPTVLGGVQVVPMVQGVPSRHGSTAARDLPPTRQGGPSDSGSGSAHTGGRFADPESPTGSNEAYQQYQRSQRSEPSDPFIESIRQRQAAAAISHSSAGPQYTQAPAVQPASPSTHYQHPEGRPSPSTQAGQGEEQYEGSNSDDEYEIDEQGRFVLDDAGNRIRYSSAVSDSDTAEYEHSPRQYRHGRAPITGPPIPMSGVEYGQGPTTSTAGNPTPTPAAQVDYSGSGYGAGGAGADWESFPRHHHPTRLSDVLEEDERSRTSASQTKAAPQRLPNQSEAQIINLATISSKLHPELCTYAFTRAIMSKAMLPASRNLLSSLARINANSAKSFGVQCQRLSSICASRLPGNVKNGACLNGLNGLRGLGLGLTGEGIVGASGPFSWTAGVLFFGVGAGLIFYFRYEKARMERKRVAEAAKGVGRPKVGGPFELLDHKGGKFGSEDMKGKYSLVYFGFTHCPDICPEELDKMAQMIDLINNSPTRTASTPSLLPIFITCDPARDTPPFWPPTSRNSILASSG
ncbi:hypothetical protein DID88_009161 [Monilinia fructigena]|uniref:Thioredoxin domain-containing protein n=1 Tax=Monilinia fructigena TaxID=38457 RepID=A0A395IER0_9HELO|nr:hypothetical protein DID88_009161 [Monilinia fructigena]